MDEIQYLGRFEVQSRSRYLYLVGNTAQLVSNVPYTLPQLKVLFLGGIGSAKVHAWPNAQL